MKYFMYDYQEGAHPRILELMLATNLEQTPGYGEDHYCDQAKALIKSLCQAPDSAVHFLIGGTQTNATLIDAALRPHQGVISADSGHINNYESGAIEASGHKVLGLPAAEGKLSAQQVDDYCRAYYADEAYTHIVQPALLYISQPTELGTLYSKQELTDLRDACRKWGLKLYVDGARLAYALAAPANDVSLPDLARLTDAFYIGGTKCGAWLGEALVINDEDLQKDFFSIQKQHGAVLAKGRLLGQQFIGLLEDGLYQQLGQHAIKEAFKIAAACREAGLELQAPPVTNQLFPVFEAGELERLEEEFLLSDQFSLADGRQAARIVTSWATKEEDADSLAAAIRALRS